MGTWWVWAGVAGNGGNGQSVTRPPSTSLDPHGSRDGSVQNTPCRFGAEGIRDSDGEFFFIFHTFFKLFLIFILDLFAGWFLDWFGLTGAGLL